MSTRKTTIVVDEAFGRRVVEIRELRGETQKQFARVIKMSQGAVVNYEVGRIPRGDICLRMANADPKKRDVVWLITGKSDGKKEKSLAGDLSGEPQPYYGPNLSKADRGTLHEVKHLLTEASDHIKEHLRNQVELLRGADRDRKRRAKGED